MKKAEEMVNELLKAQGIQDDAKEIVVDQTQ